MKQKDYLLLVGGIIAGLGALLLVLRWIGYLLGPGLPESSSAINKVVGSNGPIRIEFTREMDRQSVESRFSTEPTYPGRFEWQENLLLFWPEIPFETGSLLIFHLMAGSKSSDGLGIRQDMDWKVKIREHQVAYLVHPNKTAQLEVSSTDGSVKTQLTRQEHGVINFSGSFDGEKIIYSAHNAEGGADLWIITLQDRGIKKIVSCGTDRCTDPEWSSNGHLAAYKRWRAKIAPPLVHNPPQVWLVDVITSVTEELLPGVNFSVGQLSWSPRSRFLAVQDQTAQGIRILDFQNSLEFFIPAPEGMLGNWTYDGNRLIFSKLAAAGSSAGVSIFILDADRQSVSPISGEDLGQVEYGAPAWSVDGKWVAVGLRLSGGSPAKQIWEIHIDGNERKNLTADQLFTYASISWDSSGRRILAQRLKSGSSRNNPEIILLDRTLKAEWTVAEDGAYPEWLP